MIRLTCTQCKSVLEMDDAFAGGVCRCQHCGTIQTVPSHLKGSAVTAAAPSKSLYQGAGGGAGQSTTGLYDLADAVASSGLSRGGLQDKPSGTGNLPPARGKPVRAPLNLTLLIGAGAIILILLGLVLWLALRTTPQAQTTSNPSNVSGPSNPSSPSNPDNPAGGPPSAVDLTHKAPAVVPTAPPAPAGPHFLTVPISAKKIVYVIDRSDSARQVLDTVKAAMFNSIESLGPTREFAVVFWGRSGDKDLSQWSFPEKGMAHATPQQVEQVRDKFADVQAFGSTDPSAAVKHAVSLKPDVIFLATAKGIDLDDSFARAVKVARGKSTAQIDIIDLANGDGRKFLEPLARESHGSYTALSPIDIRPE